jgi:P pilus assembly chaperone PapD
MMSSSIVKFLFAAAVLLAGQMAACAGTLQVEPVLIDVTAPGAASTITLRNEARRRSTFKSGSSAGRRSTARNSSADRRCG